jgi:hypothetical protein
MEVPENDQAIGLRISVRLREGRPFMCTLMSSLSSTGDQPSRTLGESTSRYNVHVPHSSTGFYLPHASWLYVLFLALDANFRMSRKGVSSAERDPGLIQGHGYFVDSKSLMEHLKKHEGQRQEVFM